MVNRAYLVLFFCAYGFAAENDNWLSQHFMQPRVELTPKLMDLLGGAGNVPADTDLFADKLADKSKGRDLVYFDNVQRRHFPEAIRKKDGHLARYWHIIAKLLIFKSEQDATEEEKKSLIDMEQQRSQLFGIIPESYQAIKSVAKSYKSIIEGTSVHCQCEDTEEVVWTSTDLEKKIDKLINVLNQLMKD